MQSNVLLPQKATSCAGLDVICKSFSRSKPCAACFWLFAALWLKSLQSKYTRILSARPRDYVETQRSSVLLGFSSELDNNSWTQLKKIIIMYAQIHLQHSSLRCVSRLVSEAKVSSGEKIWQLVSDDRYQYSILSLSWPRRVQHSLSHLFSEYAWALQQNGMRKIMRT